MTIRILLLLCGVFYAVLCVFSIVTGLLYAFGKRELNPVELSDDFMSRLADPEKRRKFAARMGWVTFAVGVAQGITAFAAIRAGRPLFYWIALVFTLFSLFSVAVKLKGKLHAFPFMKFAAYLAILVLLLTGGARAEFFGKNLPAEGAGILQDIYGKDGAPMTVLCYGDSNTYGFDPRSYFGERYPEEYRWADILAEKTGLATVNGGMNGRTIPQSEWEYEQFRQSLEESQADYVIVMLGVNDLMQGASPETAAARMETFLSQITEMEKDRIVLVGIPPLKRGEWVPDESLIRASEELCAAYETVAETTGTRYVNAGGWDIDLCFDGIHFSEEGNKAFAEGLADYLLKS